MVVTGGRASVQAGAGIVYDSNPDAENEECFHKAKALLSAIEPARAMARERLRMSQVKENDND